jgi:hypothetical protein
MEAPTREKLLRFQLSVPDDEKVFCYSFENNYLFYYNKINGNRLRTCLSLLASVIIHSED